MTILPYFTPLYESTLILPYFLKMAWKRKNKTSSFFKKQQNSLSTNKILCLESFKFNILQDLVIFIYW